MVGRAVAIAVLVACGHAQPSAPAVHADNQITLYRDASLVRQSVPLDLQAGASTVKVPIASGVDLDQVVVLDHGALGLSSLHASDGGIAIDVDAPRAGHYVVQLGYVTDHLRWDAAYTMTTTPARDQALLRGAVAIRNTCGVALPRARVHVVDAELGAWRNKTAEQLAAALVGGTASQVLPATPRDLGIVDLAPGETRVDLLRAPRPHGMRAVLVYDPVGTKLDSPSASPVRDPALGEHTPETRVMESFEVQRDERASDGMPAGPVRLLERRDDGSFAVLGESRLFDAATRAGSVDTIAVGTADGVTGHRERRELTVDDEGHRITEEIVITLDNERPRPVGVLVREHLYRGQNWTLAFHSAPSAEKEGPQQIALRTQVPAKGSTTIMYVVVYTWTP